MTTKSLFETHEKIGEEYFTVKRTLTKDERQSHEVAAEETYTKEARVRAKFQAFEKWARPQIRASLDPTFSKRDKTKKKDRLAVAAAHALKKEVKRQKQHLSAAIAKIRADRDFHEDCAAHGYWYETAECDLLVDAAGTTVKYVEQRNGEVLHERAASGAERQMLLTEDDLPEGGVE